MRDWTQAGSPCGIRVRNELPHLHKGACADFVTAHDDLAFGFARFRFISGDRRGNFLDFIEDISQRIHNRNRKGLAEFNGEIIFCASTARLDGFFLAASPQS